jgi:ABC-type Fe3+ transport system substrate-binding protein
MKRYIFVILFFIVLITPFVLKRLYGRAVERGPRADALRLIIVTPHVEGIRREFAEAFSDWHQRNFGRPVFVDYRLYGGTSEIVRYFESARDSVFARQGTYKIDLVWGGGDYLFDRQLKRPGFLEPIKLSEETMRRVFPNQEFNGIPLYDLQDGTWWGTALSSFGICYNKHVCAYLGAGEPQTWSDLRDPRFSSWLVMADPTRSSSAKQAFMTVVERAMVDAVEAGKSEDEGWAVGMGLIRQMAANARFFTDASSTVPGVIGSGDAAAGMTIDFYGRSQVQAIGEHRMGYVEPRGATAINPDPIAVVRGAEHKDVAIRFVEFVLSDEGQRLWNVRAGAPGGPRLTSLRRLPISPSVYRDMSSFTDPVNPYAETVAFHTDNRRKGTFTILGELIQMSCIDVLDELRETRRAIVEAGREDLDAKLGMFPFDQAEAMRRAERWKNANPVERLKLQREWTEEFRKEYRLLREQALSPSPREGRGSG